MKSRARATVFAVGALACAGLSAAVAGTAERSGDGNYGPLVPVVVTSTPLENGAILGRKEVKAALAERRVPQSFAPPDALGVPLEALGRKLGGPVPAGSYVTVSMFKVSEPRDRRTGGLPKGSTPVEVTVTGAGALASTRTDPGDGVDVIVSGDSAPGPSAGRTYVAADGVPLLDLREAESEPGLQGDLWIATLALTRAEALSLIRAESTGAQLRLLA